MRDVTLSPLGHTWIFDLDGTVVKHNGYKIDGTDTFLPGAREFLQSLPKEDMIIFLTARAEALRLDTECFLQENGVRYDYLICGAPYGERILVNDNKPSGLSMCTAIPLKRDEWPMLRLQIDEAL